LYKTDQDFLGFLPFSMPTGWPCSAEQL